MKKKLLFIAMLAILLTSQQSLVSPAPKPFEAAASSSPNIILIFMDDMGYGDLSCNGALDIHTPNLDRLASEGIRFTNFLSSQAVCSASRASLMTGCYANRVGISGALFPGAKVGLAKDEMTIADLLKQKNYATGIFGKWHLGEPADARGDLSARSAGWGAPLGLAVGGEGDGEVATANLLHGATAEGEEAQLLICGVGGNLEILRRLVVAL